MTKELLIKIKSNIEDVEGRTSWLYLDSGSKVTCGVGHLVVDLPHARSLPFIPPITERDWNNLITSPKNCRAEFYKLDTIGRLTNDSIDEILDQDIQAAIGELVTVFPEFGEYPDSAQAALIDMEFNLGPGGFSKFKLLIMAVKDKNWKLASQQSHRIGISAERNAWTASLFAQSAVA